jgi:hypothetical protein
MLSGCISLVSKEKLDMWALSNGYILAENCPELEVPPRLALDHPEIPQIMVKDEDGEYIPITEQYLMKIVIRLFGTIEKYQYLAEIYEREYLNAGGKVMPDLTLDELKALYLERRKAIDEVPVPEPVEPVVEGEFPSTGAGVPNVEQMTIAEFSLIVETFNSFQESIESEE